MKYWLFENDQEMKLSSVTVTENKIYSLAKLFEDSILKL